MRLLSVSEIYLKWQHWTTFSSCAAIIYTCNYTVYTTFTPARTISLYFGRLCLYILKYIDAKTTFIRLRYIAVTLRRSQPTQVARKAISSNRSNYNIGEDHFNFVYTVHENWLVKQYHTHTLYHISNSWE